MRYRLAFYAILWLVLGIMLFRACVPESAPPEELVREQRPDVFDSPDAPPEQTLVLENAHLHTTWTDRGAGALEVLLKDYTDVILAQGEDPRSHWLPLYRSVPAYPPPPGQPPGLQHHRRRDGLALFESEGLLGADLRAVDWQVEGPVEEADGSRSLRFSVRLPAGVTLFKEVRLAPDSRHFDVRIWCRAEEDTLTGKDLALRLATGGGVLRERDRYYPNPYVGAATLQGGRVKGLETFQPMGKPEASRQAVRRWFGDMAFVVEGSKYFLDAILPVPGTPVRGAVVEVLFDQEEYEREVFAGLDPAAKDLLIQVVTADARLQRELGRGPTAEELGAATGLPARQAWSTLALYAERRAKAMAQAWKRASVAAAFTLHVETPGRDSQVREFRWYLGPKDPRILEQEPYTPLVAVIRHRDYGNSLFYRIFLTHYVAVAILGILKFFHAIVGNWGWAIILMTILVRAALFPINRRGQVKMAAYQARAGKVKPLLDAIKKKYKDNPQKLNEETMKLYREHKITPPVGGCLPMFIQFPVFIGLFAALRSSILLRQAPFLGWIHDLSQPDRLVDFGGPVVDFWPLNGVTTLNILPILMVVLWVLNQRMMPKPADPQQAQMQKMMAFMPVLFGLLLYNYAAGLSLYMITSSLLGIVETRFIRKHWPVPGATPAPV